MVDPSVSMAAQTLAQWWQRVCPRPLLTYCALLIGLLAWYVGQWPIVLIDTDLWRHLDSGRYLAQHGTIPTTLYFSFLSTPQSIVEYAWLFQALLYTLYTWFQYHGLVVLRVVVYLATVIMVCVFLHRQPQRGRSWWYPALLAMCYGLFLLARDQMLRPHLFSYLCILLTLYVLNYHPRRLFWLPVIGLFWSNVHGIMYPLFVWICLAYGLEAVVDGLRRPAGPSRWPGTSWLWMGLAIGTILITPHGTRLLSIPALPLDLYAPFVTEQAALTGAQFFSVHVQELMPTHNTLFNLIVLAACLTLVIAGTRRQLRISHLLLVGGGLLLLTRGVRFMTEWILLALPLLAAHPPPIRWGPFPRVARGIFSVGFALVLILSPWLFLHRKFSRPPAYPMSMHGLPEGHATFLEHVAVGGSVLNLPEPGGYLRWRLPSNYKILMDKTAWFSLDDFFTGHQAFSDTVVLTETIARYHPTFLIVPSDRLAFEQLATAIPTYVPVFFDETGVLYVDAAQQPALATRHELQAIRPFVLWQHGLAVALASDDPTSMATELQRILTIYPQGFSANWMAAAIHLHAGAYEHALPFAQTMISHFPERPIGYHVRGDALNGMGRYREARTSYAMARERYAQPHNQQEMTLQMGMMSYQAGDLARAYPLLKQAVNPFTSEPPHEVLQALGVAAREVGHQQEAEMMLRFAARKRPPPAETATSP